MGVDRAIDITAKQRKIVTDLLERHLPNTTAWVYGSRAKWASRPQSDLDLVVFATPEQNGRVSDLREALEESNLPFRVDLFVWDAVPEQFRKQIKSEHVVLVEREQREVESGWCEVTLDQLGRIVTGKTPPSSIQGAFGGDIPFVTPIDLDGRRMIASTARSLTEKGVKVVYNSRIPARSVMVSCIGSDMGKAAIAARECVTNQQINSIVVDSGDEPLFAYYNLSNRKAEIRAAAGGSAQPILNKSGFGQFDILLPPPNQQRAIAHILGTLDDKIELNRRMNETLEAMARALFKSWFVDFDPVRATMAGCDTGLPSHLADLFPDRLVDSEFGKIPEGWEVTPFSECVEVVRGLSYKGSGLSSDGVPMHNLNSIYEGGGYKHDGLKGYDGEHKSQHVARAGDLIVANTEQGHDRLLIGYAAIVPTSFVNETLFSHHIYRVRPKDCMALTSNYLCQLLNTRGMHEIVSGFANGTTVNMLPMDALQTPQIVVPAKPVLAAFNDLAEAAHRRHEEMIDGSRTLAALRDALLPNLISGELRVRGAKRFIGRTT